MTLPGLVWDLKVFAISGSNQDKRNLPIFPAPTELEVAQVVRKPVNKSLNKGKKRASLSIRTSENEIFLKMHSAFQKEAITALNTDFY